jgi:hypothetical protein
MGLIAQMLRAAKRFLRNIFGRFRRKPATEEVEIPAGWAKEPERGMEKNPEPMAEPRPKSLVIRQKKYRIRWLLTFKRGLAIFLLFVNLVLAGFMLSTQNSGAGVLFLLFLGNAFLLADYLWKTGSK